MVFNFLQHAVQLDKVRPGVIYIFRFQRTFTTGFNMEYLQLKRSDSSAP